MKRYFGLLVFALISIFILSTTVSVSAHTLKTANTVGINLHINPDDDPIVGQESTFFPDLKDKEGKFNITDCLCNVKITLEGKQAFSKELLADSNNNNLPGFNYTFETKGLYLVEFTGKSYSGSFQDFNVKFDINVTREPKNTAKANDTTNTNNSIPNAPKPSNNQSGDTTTILFLVAVTIVIIGIILFATKRFKKQRSKRKNHHPNQH